MTPIALDFGPRDRAARVHKRLVTKVDDAVSALTLGVAAGAIGCRPPALRDALDGRNGSRLSSEWAGIIAERVGPGALQDAILDAIREQFGLYQPESDRDYIHRLEGGFLRFGEAGMAMLAQLRREARR
jgi:hypothetical protein